MQTLLENSLKNENMIIIRWEWEKMGMQTVIFMFIIQLKYLFSGSVQLKELYVSGGETE